jgi:hypothetical protein
VPCRVESTNEDSVVARDTDDVRVTLDKAKLLAPTGVTQLNLERHFARTRERTAFANAVTQAGAPRVPRAWRPTGKERVVARSNAGWFSARVRDIEDDGVLVEWTSDGRVSRVGPSELVPEPPWGPAPERGALALLRPEAATRAWQPVRVVSAGPEYVVENAAGERRGAALRDLLPLGSP